MRLLIKVLLLTLLAVNSFYSQAREYHPPFTPQRVIVADGHLQIVMLDSVTISGCTATKTVSLLDADKYFDSFLSLATKAFIAGKKLNVAVATCDGNVWPIIKVMMLQH
ncbi:hypothetical protein tinsulaeT_20900 [Thalassotalea insulae]|uniref:Uncharacterized protein n=1 Tax=Thalassotalea insulae TaxID=2056778 RepID=A0ABQ6GS33_9GAMM|nr:hypothetical protein [Thalassotalea insulae]GLX78750.1 hypothetical protein tinsulaeT_20900 [Thalassotalea insulae]